MSDGAHFYVDATSGQIVATRTRWWRFYDLMWGLHIMDPQTREDTHNPFVILLRDRRAGDERARHDPAAQGAQEETRKSVALDS